MTESAPSSEADLQAAGRRLMNVAVGLAGRFSPRQAAQLLVGAAVGLLGLEASAELLATIVYAIEHGEGGDTSPAPPAPAGVN